LCECSARYVQEELRPYFEGIVERFPHSKAYPLLAQAQTLQQEIPFALRVGDGLINGAIDAILDDGTIMDYKTGQPNPECLREYEYQLRLYAAAVSGLLGVQPPAAFLYYVDADELKAVDVSPERIREALVLAEEAMAAVRAKNYGLEAEEGHSE
jgi:ATP-dependent exoDNAse (exonuclease V) beta subunit